MRKYNCEDAFIIALKNCKKSDEIMNILQKIDIAEIGTNNMAIYDSFIKKYSSLRYCYEC